ncbi:unnamed protein product [Blepharisma stoltei]|uniref:Casein kinase II subunit beta n=1 Tax=Blepharisma stoltei TaxID=1481888 RepID=A0AAU9IZ72_9CILI|nr:unnamed protein product [Blepharisma stoltei]
MILSKEVPDDEDFDNEVFMGVYQSAIDLYGQIHARFIRSPLGLAIMKEKYLSGEFGICPRALCDGQNALPLGESEELREYGVRLFCPKCKEAYIPSRRYENVDGACFGMSFPHILLETYTDLYIYEKGEEFIPKLYGFKIYGHRGSEYYEEPIEIEEEEKFVEEAKEAVN